MPFHLQAITVAAIFVVASLLWRETSRKRSTCGHQMCPSFPLPSLAPLPRLARPLSLLRPQRQRPLPLPVQWACRACAMGQWTGSDDVSWANGRRGGALSSDTLYSNSSRDSEGLNAEGGMPGRLPPQCCDNNMLRWDLKDACTQSVFV